MNRTIVCAVIAVCALGSQAALAQWAWKDAKGTTVYSDQPPPADIKPSQVIRQPGAGSMLPASSDPSPAPAAATKPPKTAAQMDAEFRKRQSDKAQAETKAAADAERDRQRNEQCARMRSSVQILQEGQRVRSPTTGGPMDDAERANETARLQKSIAEACK